MFYPLFLFTLANSLFVVITQNNTSSNRFETNGNRKIKPNEIVDGKNLTGFEFATSDFARIVDSPTFVDKTMFISELFEPYLERNVTRLMTAPAKFGKSTVLNMVKRFFELELDESGSTKTKSYYLVEPIKDTDNYRLFERLRIANESIIMNGYFGSFPIIDVSFEVKSSSGYRNNIVRYEDVLNIFGTAIGDCYRRYRYLANSSLLSADDKRDFGRWLLPNKTPVDDYDSVTNGLRNLIGYVSIHFQRPTMVLIDRYDDYLENLNFRLAPQRVPTKRNELLLNEMMNVQRTILSKALSPLEVNDDPFNNNNSTGDRLFACLIAGRINVLNLPFVRYYPFGVQHRFTDYYGLTDSEVTTILRRRPNYRRNLERYKRRLRSHYGGYRVIVEEDVYTDKIIYNPWSIGRFFSGQRKNKYDDYWPPSDVAVRNLTLALTACSVKLNLETLIQGGTLRFLYYRQFDAFDVISLATLMRKPELELYYTEYYSSYLLQRGYLTAGIAEDESFSKIRINRTDEQELGYKLFEAKLPNREVRNEFRRLLNRYYGEDVCKFDRRLIQKCRVFFQDRLFVLVDDANSERLKIGLKKLLRIIVRLLERFTEEKPPDPLGDESDEDEGTVDVGGIQLNEDGIHSLLFYILYETKTGCVTETTAYNFRTDLAMIKNRIGLVLNVKYKYTSKIALEEILLERYHFNRLFNNNNNNNNNNSTARPVVDKTIFIGLNVDQKRIPTFGYLIDSTDIERAEYIP